MKRIIKYLSPTWILTLAIIGLGATIFSIAGRIYLQGILPDSWGYYNTQGFAVLFLWGTIGLITPYFLLVKLKTWMKVLCIPVSWVLVFFLSTWTGHTMVDALTKMYYNTHKDSLKELITTAQNANICLITNHFSKNGPEIFDCETN